MSMAFNFFVAITIILVVIAIYIWKRKSDYEKLKMEVEKRWGKEPKREYKAEDINILSGYFKSKVEDNKIKHFIDDITWNDLDMDRVYKKINNTLTTVGEEYLYGLLREPIFDPECIKERGSLIEYFQKDKLSREKLQMCLLRLGKPRIKGIYDYFSAEEKPFSKRLIYILMALLPLFSLLTMLFNLNTGIMLLILSISINIITSIRKKADMEYELVSLSYLTSLIATSKSILNLKLEKLDKYNKILEDSYAVLKKAAKRYSFIVNKIQDPFMLFETLKMIFLIDIVVFESANKALLLHKKELEDLYQAVGFLDSMLSAASYRETLKYYTVPALSKTDEKRRKYLDFTDMYHPLIKDPVVNSLKLDGSILITGSNASGKSTFIKMVAINAILAQTIHTCLAKEYSSCYFRVYTSMALKDDLESRESYYIVEIKSLKRIIDSLDNEIPCLCFVDEVLRGTNTIERIAASSQILKFLSESNCMCFAATHDIELTSILRYNFTNYHFQEDFNENDIVFDYKLQPGKAYTRNAIRLLKILGYEESIINRAEDSASTFVNDGIWKELRNE